MYAAEYDGGMVVCTPCGEGAEGFRMVQLPTGLISSIYLKKSPGQRGVAVGGSRGAGIRPVFRDYAECVRYDLHDVVICMLCMVCCGKGGAQCWVGWLF